MILKIDVPILKEGELAPHFVLALSSGQDFSLNSVVSSQNLVLYFYPKDMTSQLMALNTIIVGISRDRIDSHKKFICKEGLSFESLSDPEGEVCREYGVLTTKNNLSKKHSFIARTTFLIARGGTIKRIWRNITSETHAQKVFNSTKVLFSIKINSVAGGQV